MVCCRSKLESIWTVRSPHLIPEVDDFELVELGDAGDDLGHGLGARLLVHGADPDLDPGF